VDDSWVAALVVVTVFGAPCAVWLVTRVLAHQERMEMMRRGFTPPPDSREMRRAMKRGWIPGPTVPDAAYQYQYGFDMQAQYQLRRGIQVAFIGLALFIGLGFIGYRGGGVIEPGPWLLGGLIPLFVGIAQIVSAVLSGATFGTPASRGRFGPPPNPSGSEPESTATGAMPPGPTYGGWRPGAIPEIEKPASPPDYRS
jgi:hypothetical protein